MKKLIIIGSLAYSLPILAQNKPNVIVILADDMRASSLECLNKEKILTPNLNKLAQDGTLFSNAHIMGGTSGAVSMPSRAMLLTGRYLHQLEKQGSVIPAEHTTLGEALQNTGYQTFHIGKWHSDKPSFNRCFKDGKDIFFGGMSDQWNVPLYNYDPTGKYEKKRPVIPDFLHQNKITYENGEYMYSGKHSVDVFTDAAIEYISENKDKKQPFFLYLAYMSPHDPRSMPQEFLDRYNTKDIELPANFMEKHPFNNGELIVRDEQLAATPRIPDEIKEHIRSYYAMITHLDNRIGKLIEYLKANNMYDNTLIIFSGDNGLAVGQHGLMGKQNVYEHSTNVPLIIKQPGKQEAKKTDRMCYLIDLFPTICETTGAAKPASVDGTSLMPILKENKSVRDYMYLSYRHFQRAVSDGEWKLIEYRVNGTHTTQLFNLKNDPLECNDLSSQKKYSKIMDKLRKQMMIEKEATKDQSPFWN